MSEAQRPSPAPSLVIIGNGVTGITAARVARKLLPDLNITIISDESDLFFSRTALMYIYMGHMHEENTRPYSREFFSQNRLDLVRGVVSAVDPASRSVTLLDGRRLAYDFLLLALGSVSNKFGWPGQDLKRVQGLYSLQDLGVLEENTNPVPSRAVIVGGGLIGIELAEMLQTRGIPITFLVREASYMNHVFPTEESELINREIRRHPGVELRLGSELREIVADGEGAAAGVITGTGDRIECGLVGLTAGVSPNLTLARTIPGLKTGRGVHVNGRLETSLPRVFAAGDCAELVTEGAERGVVEQLWYTGRMQGEVAGRRIAQVAASLCSPPRSVPAAAPYDRGIWFNSAKFFNLEWQTYGLVPKEPDPGRSFWWQEEDGSRGIRLVWEASGTDTRITGFNFMGCRFRQDVCQSWIREDTQVEKVVAQLAKANFDPEFFSGPEPALKRAFENRSMVGVS